MSSTDGWLSTIFSRKNPTESPAPPVKKIGRLTLTYILLRGGKVLKGWAMFNGTRITGVNPRHKKEIVRELEIYRALPPHPSIVHFFGVFQPAGYKEWFIEMEYAAQGDLRAYIQNTAIPPHMQRRLRWSEQIAAGVHHLHDNGVLHHDLSCRNIFLDAHGSVKIGDFGASALPGQKGLGAEEGRYQLPRLSRDKTDPIKDELFALGCAIYEIVAWCLPHSIFSEDEAELLYESGVFPDTKMLPAGPIMQGCWWEQYTAAAQVEVDLGQALDLIIERRTCDSQWDSHTLI